MSNALFIPLVRSMQSASMSEMSQSRFGGGDNIRLPGPLDAVCNSTHQNHRYKRHSSSPSNAMTSIRNDLMRSFTRFLSLVSVDSMTRLEVKSRHQRRHFVPVAALTSSQTAARRR